MKKCIIFIIISLLVTSLYGQENDETKNSIIGINSSVRIADVALIQSEDGTSDAVAVEEEIMIFPTIHFRKEKHSVHLGYDFVNKYGYFLMGYQYYPMAFNDKLQLYYPFDILFKSIQTHRFNTNTDITKKEIYTKLTMGVGLQYLIKKGLHINIKSGLGINYNSNDYNKTSYGSNYSYKTDNLDLGLFFQIGIGYDFHLTKK